MKDVKTALIMITVITILVLSIIVGGPFRTSTPNKIFVHDKNYSIIIVNGKITQAHIMLTVIGDTAITNGTIQILQVNDRTITKTIYIVSNNKVSSLTATITYTSPPRDAIITYRTRYLTYNGLSYYTDTNPPITFWYSTTHYISNTIFVEIKEATVSWLKTSRK